MDQNRAPEPARGGVLLGGHGDGAGSRWLLTYADLITLMMVFFVVMYSMANVDKQKYAAVAGALHKAFGGDRVVGLPGAGNGAGGTSEQQGAGSQTQAKDPLLTLGEQLLERQRNLQGGQIAMGPNPGSGTNTAPEPPVQVFYSRRGLVLSLAGSALFGPDDANIRPLAQPVLQLVAESLRSVPNQISVEGSEAASAGGPDSFARGWSLSQQRAAAITRYLIEQERLDPARLFMVAYGEWRPVAPNATEAGRAQNRRVDVVILRDEPDLDRGQSVQAPAPPSRPS